MEYLHLLILKLKPHFTIQSKDTKEKRLSMIKHIRKMGENDHWRDKQATKNGGLGSERVRKRLVSNQKQILAVHFYGFYRHFYELEFGKTFV